MLNLTKEQKQQISKGSLRDFDSTMLKIWLHLDSTKKDITKEELANLAGLSLSTIKRTLTIMEELNYIKILKEDKKTLYETINQNAQNQVKEADEVLIIEEAPVEPKPKAKAKAKEKEKEKVVKEKKEQGPVLEIKTARDFILKFCELYLEKYEVAYMPNWSRDVSLVKTKLMSNYNEQQLQEILKITFELFDKKWANKNYPRPSIGAVATFIANEAITMSQQKEKREQIMEKAQREAEDFKKYFKQQF